MTNKEFTIWLRGFAEACGLSAPTDHQWDTIIQKLQSVKEESKNCTCETYTYPYKGFSGDGTYVTTDAKTQLND